MSRSVTLYAGDISLVSCDDYTMATSVSSVVFRPVDSDIYVSLRIRDVSDAQLG